MSSISPQRVVGISRHCVALCGGETTAVRKIETRAYGITFISVLYLSLCGLCCALCRWLIEVNASPSLTASSKEDYDLKCRLLDDVLNVIDLENRFSLRLFYSLGGCGIGQVIPSHSQC